jgi:hypothetical protein
MRNETTQMTKVPQQRPGHPLSQVTNENRYRILLGSHESGRTCEWNIRRDRHLLIAGIAGSGKSVLTRSVIMQWTRRGWPVWVVDPTLGGFAGMRSWPGVQRYAGHAQQIRALIRQAWGEVERRYDLLLSGQDEGFEPLLLVLDAFDAMRARVKASYAEIWAEPLPERCPELRMLQQLIAMAGAVDVHLVVAVHRPRGDLVGDHARSDFRARVSLGPLSPLAAVAFWGSRDVGVEVPAGRGFGIGMDDAGTPMAMQAVWTPDPARVGSSADVALLRELRGEIAPDGSDGGPEEAVPSRPRIVVLCGSTRFPGEFAAANYRETIAGRVVLTVGVYPHAQETHGHGEGGDVDAATKIALDDLHKHKIDLADEVLVLDVDGYIGDSTRSEIDYAVRHGKPVRYRSQEVPG